MSPIPVFRLSASDVEAILAALPIVEAFPAATEQQKFLNRMACHSARQKLVAGRKDFTANDLRVISVAVGYAAEYLSGRLPKSEGLIPDASAIRAHALSYVALNSFFLTHPICQEDQE